MKGRLIRAQTTRSKNISCKDKGEPTCRIRGAKNIYIYTYIYTYIYMYVCIYMLRDAGFAARVVVLGCGFFCARVWLFKNFD